jgi:nucleoside-diphosphate-sugar epimerase
MGIRRFVFASTCSVYGACDEMLDEKSEPRPVSLYGNTKLLSEKVLRELADDDFSPTVLRFATIYGLSGRTRFDLVVNLLAAKAKVDGKITVFNGQQWRPFLHVLDAAHAIKLAIDAPVELVHNEIFNVGSSDQNHTILEVGELIHQQVIGAELLVDETQTDPRNYRIDFSKIRDFLDFHPTWTVEEGVQQVLTAIASGKVGDYRDPKYSNFEFLNLQGTTELARDHWAFELIRDLESV